MTNPYEQEGQNRLSAVTELLEGAFEGAFVCWDVVWLKAHLERLALSKGGELCLT